MIPIPIPILAYKWIAIALAMLAIIAWGGVGWSGKRAAQLEFADYKLAQARVVADQLAENQRLSDAQSRRGTEISEAYQKGKIDVAASMRPRRIRRGNSLLQPPLSARQPELGFERFVETGTLRCSLPGSIAARYPKTSILLKSYISASAPYGGHHHPSTRDTTAKKSQTMTGSRSTGLKVRLPRLTTRG